MSQPFPNEVVGGGGQLVIPQVRSPDYAAGSAGWSIKIDGSAEFNNLVIRGTFNGTDFVINSSGAFYYSPSEGPGNLVASITPAGGTDQFGNFYLQGVASYGASSAVKMGAGLINFYLGSLAAGWTAEASINVDGSGNLTITPTSKTTLQAAAEVTGNLQVDGTLTLSIPLPVSGSSATAGLPDGTIHGTSGGASAGTAHTHGPGSFAVGNGQHSHGAGSYEAT